MFVYMCVDVGHVVHISRKVCKEYTKTCFLYKDMHASPKTVRHNCIQLTERARCPLLRSPLLSQPENSPSKHVCVFS